MKYVGIAPRVRLLNVKFSDDQGNAAESDLISALQWVYENRAWFNGVVVVAAAGNRGGEECSVCYAPANDPYVITVGAADDNGTRDLSDDVATLWSSAGETLDGHRKPDILAPGSRMVSFMPAGILRDHHPENVVDTHYFRMGGTSMSAPVVSGVVALMLQVNPKLTPDQVKWRLMKPARSYPDRPQGTAGIVDAYSAALFKGAGGKANQGLEPSPLLAPGSGTIDYSNVLWGNVLWGNALWANGVEY
jgi:serine protease AprX